MRCAVSATLRSRFSIGGLSNDRPVVILSGNSIEHGILALGAMYAGIMYVPVAPSYSLIARDFTTLRALWDALNPGLVFAAEGQPFDRALKAVRAPEVVTCRETDSFASTLFDELAGTCSLVCRRRRAHASGSGDDRQAALYVGFDRTSEGRHQHAADDLFESGNDSNGDAASLPKSHRSSATGCRGITRLAGITTSASCSSMAARSTSTPASRRPRRSRPRFATCGRLRRTAYFNVPRGYDLLVPRLRADAAFCRHFFSRLKMLFCAAASLRQQIADDLTELATSTSGVRIPFVTGLGATESAPFALCAGDADFTGGRIGVPAPGVELKLAPVGQQMEGRLRGPNITPGYWADEKLTEAAFDDEGYYRLGDALAFFDPDDPHKGFTFQGRIAEDFKLSTGTWVRVGPLRARMLAEFGDLVHDVAIAGPDRDYVTALIFPNIDACRSICAAGARERTAVDVLRDEAVRSRVGGILGRLASESVGLSTSVVRAILMEQPPSIDAHETTEKGSINQKAVLANRAALVDELYAERPTAAVIEVAGIQ